MKRIIYIFIFQIFIGLSVQAQTGVEWQSCFSVKSSGLMDVCKTKDGGYLMVGTANLDTAFWTSLMGDGDFGVIRTDSVGNLVWKRTYGGNKLDAAMCVIKGIRPNRYYIAGVSRSEGSTNYHSPSNFGDAWLIAIDSAGNQLWNMCYGGYVGEAFHSLIQLGDSNIIYGIGLTGSPSNSGDVSMNYKQIQTGWICKINANNGTLIKERVYGGTNNDELYNSIKLNNNSFLVQGVTQGRDHDVWTHYGNGQTVENGWLLNIDTALNIVWQKTIGTSGGEGRIDDVVKTQDGGFAVWGRTVNRPGDTSSFTFYVDTLPPYGTRKKEAFIIKYDSLGNELWQQHYSAPLDPVGTEGRFVQMQDKGFVFSSVVSKWHGFALWPYSYGSVLFRTDSVGNFVSASRYGNGNGGGLQTRNLFTTWDNKLVVASRGSAACSSSNKAGWSIFQIGHQLAIEDNSKAKPSIKVYPNPSNGIINIDFENTDGIKRISIYNTLGQMIESTSVNTNLKHYRVNLNGKPKGLYFIVVETNNGNVYKKILLE